MKLDEIFESWKQDSVFDREELTEESIRIPQLHSKYMKILSTERMRLRGYQKDFNILYKDKREYYSGNLDQSELKERGWEPFSLKIVRQDLDIHIKADDDIIVLQSKMDIQKEKVSVVEGILQQINNRGFQIKSVIDWERFKVGQ